jgi:long-chain acyl-CoA synthetase
VRRRFASLCPDLKSRGDRVALYDKEIAVTYGELSRRVDNMAANIRRTGVTEGDRVGLCLQNCAEFIYGYLAVLSANCTPVLLSPELPTEKLTFILEDSGAKGLLSNQNAFRKAASGASRLQFAFISDYDQQDESGSAAVYSLQESAEKDYLHFAAWKQEEKEDIGLPSNLHEIAAIIYTSGTTGKPKGVMLSETNLVVATDAIIEHMKITPEDACLVTMSYAHCAGLLHMLSQLRAGSKIVTGQHYVLIGQLLGAIKKRHVTILPAVPSFYALLLKHPKEKIMPYLDRDRKSVV